MRYYNQNKSYANSSPEGFVSVMWKYSRGACYIIYDPRVLPLRYGLCGWIISEFVFVLRFVIFAKKEKQEKQERQKKRRKIPLIPRFFLVPPFRYPLDQWPLRVHTHRVFYAITLCIKNKNRRARKETVRHQFPRTDRIPFFFHAIKSPSPPPPPPPSALLLLLPCRSDAQAKKFPNRKRKIIIIRRKLVRDSGGGVF